MSGPVGEIQITISDKADEKNDTSSSENSTTETPAPPPADAEPPTKPNPPKSSPPESPSPPSPDPPAKKPKDSPDDSEDSKDSKPAAKPPPSNPTPEQASNSGGEGGNNNNNNNNNNNINDNKSAAPAKKPPSSSSSSSSSSTPATPSSSDGDKNSPPSEQASTSFSTFSAPDTRPEGPGSATNPLPLPPGNAGVSGIPSNTGGSGSGIPAPSAAPSPVSSNPAWTPHPGVVVGLTLAAVCICGLIAILIACAVKKKKKKGHKERSHAKYMPSPKIKHSVNSDDRGGPQKQHNHSGTNSGSNAYEGSPASHRGGMRNPESPLILGGVTFFSYEELVEITNGFAPHNVIGEGGFGCVFKGWLLSGKPVAVKQLKVGGKQGEREFRAEVDIISRIHHRHLVSLVGYCISDDQRILIYEFVPNNNLQHHLRGTPVLDWSKRVKIAIGAAKGLAYLHEDCSPKIIHRDIKSANILLDNSFEAKVADFGLAKIAEDSLTHVSTRVMGTFGYMAPEYANSGKLTDRSDVFSYGVVLLELVTGRKPVDPTQPLGEESLVEWARPLLLRTIETGDCSELVDPRLEKNYVESEMITMIEAAAACIRHSAPRRPRMVQVIRALDTHFDMSDLSNGMKYGESTIYDSGQYNEDIAKFRRSQFDSGNEESIEYSMISSNELSLGPASSGEFTSGESETRPFNSSIGRRGRQFK